MQVSPEDVQALIYKLKDGTISEREMVLLQLYTSLPDGETTLNAVDFTGMKPAELLSADQEASFRAITAKISKSKRVIPWKRWAVAAAVLIMAGSYLTWSNHKNTNTPAIALNSGQPSNSFNDVKAKPALTTIENTGTTVKPVHLTDGSVVELASGSTITYEEPFAKKERTLQLEGTAYFSVATNASAPFIVNSGDLSTTALGTSFTIRPGAAKQGWLVLLHTGKVIVKQRNELSRNVMKDTYLLPGQELVYDGLRQTAMVRRTGTLPSARIQSGIQLSFDQAPLATVLKRISESYRIDLEFDSLLVKGRSFSGTIRKKDSLEEVLQGIAELHNLVIEKIPNGYRLR